MKLKNGRIGIDIGALYTKGIRLAENNTAVLSYYQRHRGNIAASVLELLKEFGFRDTDTIGLTGSAAHQALEILHVPVLDIGRCQIERISNLFSNISDIIDIGGGSTTIIQLDKNGKFQDYATNSMCAAGTGSFLDEQAGRLNLSYEELGNFNFVENPPSIATRCSVFAKSDLIHRQQEGFGKDAMWSGLCRGMTRTMLGTLLNGRPLKGKTVVIGGVAKNQEVLRWLNQTYPGNILVPEKPEFITAEGAALLGNTPAQPISLNLNLNSTQKTSVEYYPWQLSLDKSIYPSFDVNESFIDKEGNEIRITDFPDNGTFSGYLGIDIGSTSTKLVLINKEEKVMVDIYRKTAGDPIQATKLLFKALNFLQKNKNSTLKILGVGTTGSGRKIVGEVIGADVIINEISAHVAGAVKTDPTVDTIFEIGGQDSKYMHVKDGHIRDANMNYVCAAGTGSFVEEVAGKLGFAVSQAGPILLGRKPPRATDRCTVFMDQDVVKLIQSGAKPEDALAAVMVSVTKNYLNKVVGNRHYSRDKIFFQGATARNPALVAAFEHLLDVKLIVSPYCHVMGSFGVALLVKQHMAVKKINGSRFMGLDLDQRKITLRKQACDLCQNDCAITYAEIQGSNNFPSWGYMCGRDPEESKKKKTPQTRHMKTRQRLWRETGGGTIVPDNAPVIGIPQTLTTFTYLPLWKKFFNELGYRVQLSENTNEKIRELGTTLSGADFCFPAKVAIGHVASLFMKEGVDFIFVPQMANELPRKEVTSSVFCPYVQGLPAYSKSALELNGIDTSRILTPVYDRRLSEHKLLTQISSVLSRPLGRSREQIKNAWVRGIRAQNDFTEKCRMAGRQAYDEAKKKNEKLLVLVGRPYNNFDRGMNLDLPQKIGERGKTVLPMDFLEIDLNDLGEKHRNVYWGYGQRIIASLERISRDELLDAVYLTNFNCGPDSFLLSYAEEIMGNQPFLALELDEHGADAGYLTRIEAFLDVLSRQRRAPRPRKEFPNEPGDLRNRIIWLPPMHEYSTLNLVSAFRHHGYMARELPLEKHDTFDQGRLVTRGSECLPTSLTIGTMLNVLKSYPQNGHKHALFMPTAQGPCRFGQYCVLHKQILDREGHHDVFILSPSSINSYQGLEDELRRTMFKGLVAGDILLKARCKIRPYEINQGETDKIAEEHKLAIAKAIESGNDIEGALRKAIQSLSKVKIQGPQKPLVGIVGEIYIRNNQFGNENLIDAIEKFGGEVWMTPISEWILYTSSPLSFMQYLDKVVSKKALKSYLTYKWQKHWEHRLYKVCSPLLDDRREPAIATVLRGGLKYMPMNIGGEAISIIGRAIEYAKQGASLVVNCAPFGCMPGTVTTALFRKISKEISLPVVNLFYDGTGNENKRLAVYLNNSIKK